PMQLEGRHQEMLTRFRAALDRRGLEPSQLAVDDAAEYGILLALTGNHTAAVALLEPRTDVSLLRSGREGHHVAHALAWAHLRAGSAEKAARIVQRLEVDLGTRQSNGLLHL